MTQETLNEFGMILGTAASIAARRAKPSELPALAAGLAAITTVLELTYPDLDINEHLRHCGMDEETIALGSEEGR